MQQKKESKEKRKTKEKTHTRLQISFSLKRLLPLNELDKTMIILFLADFYHFLPILIIFAQF